MAYIQDSAKCAERDSAGLSYKGGAMKSEMFDKIVEARANERVQEKIKKLKRAIGTALTEMKGHRPGMYPEECCREREAREILAILGSDNPNSGFPKTLWEREREAVTKELLGIMDEMQKALLAADRSEPGEHTPEKVRGEE